MSRGHRVGITGRRAHLLEEIAGIHKDCEVFVKAFDVSADSAAGSLAELVEDMGGVDLCLYSSGYGHTNVSLEPSLELGQVDVNAKGFVRCAVWLFNFWA